MRWWPRAATSSSSRSSASLVSVRPVCRAIPRPMVSVPKLILTAWMTESAGRQLLLLGATGLVGAQVLSRLLADPRVARITAPTGRPLDGAAPRAGHPRGDYAARPAA